MSLTRCSAVRAAGVKVGGPVGLVVGCIRLLAEGHWQSPSCIGTVKYGTTKIPLLSRSIDSLHAEEVVGALKRVVAEDAIVSLILLLHRGR